jgi:hypothetical protein
MHLLPRGGAEEEEGHREKDWRRVHPLLPLRTLTMNEWACCEWQVEVLRRGIFDWKATGKEQGESKAMRPIWIFLDF